MKAVLIVWLLISGEPVLVTHPVKSLSACEYVAARLDNPAIVSVDCRVEYHL